MSKSKKQPYMPFYIGDWKKDLGVQSLSFYDRQVWFELLMLMHDSEERGVLILNGQVPTYTHLCMLLHQHPTKLANSIARIKAAGVCSVREDGAIYCRRMVQDTELSKIRSEAGTKGAMAKYNKLDIAKEVTNADIDIDIDNLILIKGYDHPKMREALKLADSKLKQSGRRIDQIMLDALIMNFNNPKDLYEALMYTAQLSKSRNVIKPPAKSTTFAPEKPKPRPLPKDTPLAWERPEHKPETRPLSELKREIQDSKNAKN